MRTFVFGIVALLAFVVPGATQEGGFQVPVTLGPPTSGFQVPEGGLLVTAEFVMGDPRRQPRAAPMVPVGPDTTDVVVTDADGRVLECWRGDFKPGEIVRLGPGRLPLAHALPWELLRLRPDRMLSKLYRNFGANFSVRGYYERPADAPTPVCLWPITADAEDEVRFVLFLRKEVAVGLPTIWLPATVQQPQGLRWGSHFSAEPASANGGYHFTDDVVLVEGGRVVAPRKVWQRFGNPNPYSTEPVAATLAEFKTAAMRYTRPMSTGEIEVSVPRRWADVGPLAGYSLKP